ncbi:MAG: geranylgeranyl reductase family protein [Candidatus Heimdallarchaeaceae archaeon]
MDEIQENLVQIEKIDVGIVGAGPAGLSAGLALANNGYKTTIFEEHKIVGIPIQCGEGISEKVFIEFPILKTNKEFIIRKFGNTKIYFPGDYTVFGDTHAYMIRRDKFDQFLAQQVKKSGGKILTNSRVIDAIETKEGVKIKIKKDGTEQLFLSSVLLIAEGPKGDIARKLGFNTPELIRALEYRIQGEFSDTMEFFFDNEKYPFGYSWIFPRNNETNVGVVTTAKNRKEILDKFLKERNISGKIIKKIGGSIPKNGVVKQLATQKIALIGDTGGFTNPLFYGGIRNAMLSGKIVADIIDFQRKNEKKFDLRTFDKEVRKHPFSAKISIKSHKYFYTRSVNFQKKIGKVFNGTYINRIENKELLKYLLKLVCNPILIKNPKKLYWLYKGFKQARDYGF